MKLLVIDNYDSFVFNVVRYCEELGQQVRVFRNDHIDVAGVEAEKPDAIIISPGPFSPSEAGVSVDIIKTLSGRTPILGICLGHQCIGAAFGADIRRAREPMHGRPDLISHEGTGLFAGLPSPLKVGRYHSLIVEMPQDMAMPLCADAMSPEGEIMALSHIADPTFGVQFHPESILTEHGHDLLANFFRIAANWHARGGISSPPRPSESPAG